jgi:hypothetical protein
MDDQRGTSQYDVRLVARVGGHRGRDERDDRDENTQTGSRRRIGATDADCESSDQDAGDQ